ncbi:SCP-like extracellular family protein [Hyphomonas neptunium ATCC 15444]|uniref:SCP-like extracellular family protein n=2 Tax=Hyphomonas TaxID=85 RepID=Q0BWN1_HYPNA|nr:MULTISPECIES: CAP domain-containing protein [Hyphomonas]ABI76172.1 SCP-like extracellular family protein [Hyphomonas neptunium ATCC 15444]KCZ91890.1 SCP-like extracellular family protein [Hyphomonas hirschiana VP5]
MHRVIASLAFLLLLPLQAFACDLRIQGRPLAVAPYVERAQPCLARPPAGFAFEESLEARFLDLVNKERAEAGLAPLQLRRELIDAARLHSLDMAVNGFFGHVGPDGRGPGDRIAALDRTALADFSAENVATVSRVGGRIGANFAVKRLHRNLMDSPSHRENILHSKATHVAFGVVRTQEGVWVTQLFMRVSGTLARAAPLRLSAAQSLRERPLGLEGWRFVRYDMVAPSGDPFPGTSGARPGLDARLAAYATQPGDDPRSYYWMRFPGPAVTVIP